MKVMYLDESGDHSLDKIDPNYPVFVLGGVIIDRAHVRTVVAPRIAELKSAFFLDEDTVLHTADIIRAKNGFEILKDEEVRERFYAELNKMMRELEYKVVACAIKKDGHVAQYRASAADPYMYSLHILVERLCKELGDVPDGGYICAEKRGLELDRELERAWSRLKRSGTTYVSAAVIDERIIDLGTKEKSLDIAGLELADLVVSPIGRYVMGKPPQEDWWIVESKFRRSGTRYQGYGLVVLPK